MKIDAVFLYKTLRIDRFDRDEIFGTLPASGNYRPRLMATRHMRSFMTSGN